jgi:riboflavin kinase / FMN adenylyltransferase
VTHYHSLDELKLKKAWLTVGVFDGVHRGHQELIRRLVTGAHAAKAPSVVLTFEPHPAVVLGGQSDFKCLTTVAERAALLDSLGVDEVITMTFDRALADETAEDFMGSVSRALGLRALLIGYDTALGRGREGNAARLEEIGRQLRYRLEVVPPVHADGEVISSTRIRARLAVGDVAAATGFLGRPYFFSGPVIHGDGRGHNN